MIYAAAIEGHFEGKRPRESHRALATQKKLACLVFQYIDHPPYSPDLASSDNHLLPGLKEIESSPFFVQRGGHTCREDQVGRTKV